MLKRIKKKYKEICFWSSKKCLKKERISQVVYNKQCSKKKKWEKAKEQWQEDQTIYNDNNNDNSQKKEQQWREEKEVIKNV